ncbi:hypothetical protein THAOC_27240, partial [Thalassiosira oceanica]
MASHRGDGVAIVHDRSLTAPPGPLGDSRGRNSRAGGTINGRGRITLEDGKTLVFRDGHFELLTDEDVDGDARALGIGELETLVTTEIVVARGKFEGLPAQLLGNNGKGQFYVLVNVDGAMSTTRIKNRSIGFS